MFAVECLQWQWQWESLSRVWFCYSIDYSPPGSRIHGILQARILECLFNLWINLFWSINLNPQQLYIGRWQIIQWTLGQLKLTLRNWLGEFFRGLQSSPSVSFFFFLLLFPRVNHYSNFCKMSKPLPQDWLLNFVFWSTNLGVSMCPF